MAEILFHSLIETIYSLPLEEREELQMLLSNNINDSRRSEIAGNSNLSKEEEKSGALRFSSNIDGLKEML